MAAQKGELIFIIDGSQTGNTHTTLMLSVLWKNWAIPVVWTVKKGEKGHFPEKMHLDLLQSLRPIVPAQCRIVILGDGEFDGAGLRNLIQDENWEFVVRTSSDRKIDCGDGEMAHISSLSPPKGHRSVFVSDAISGANAVCWHEKRFEKPIFLLTNMDLGWMACCYYKKRFKIETMFKQLKSRGVHLHKTQLLEASKISNLIIVVAAAFIFTLGLGLFLKQKNDAIALGKMVRKEKLPKIDPFILAQRCWMEHFLIALAFFSELSWNLNWLFLD